MKASSGFHDLSRSMCWSSRNQFIVSYKAARQCTEFVMPHLCLWVFKDFESDRSVYIYEIDGVKVNHP